MLSTFDRALHASGASELETMVHLPPSVAAKTPAERSQWLREMLEKEVSASGLQELRRHARFGPLLQIFPLEAVGWAAAASYPVDECVAFRMERAGMRAEVVLHQTPTGFQILRCNNVKQMAIPTASKS